MSFKSLLLETKQELESSNRSPQELFQICVEERLNNGLESYNQQVENYYQYLLKCDSLRMLKRCSKELK